MGLRDVNQNMEPVKIIDGNPKLIAHIDLTVIALQKYVVAINICNVEFSS